nr:catalase-peroxidase [Candidatus Cloacimonadota bacterium]
AHGAGSAKLVGPEPEAAPIEEQGLGWKNKLGTGKGEFTTTSGIEGAWKPNPTKWDNGYLEMLFTYDWELVDSPAGAKQWYAKNVKPEHMIPNAHNPSKKHPPMMTTADLSLKFDPVLEPIARRYYHDFAAFQDAFARAWFKLTHRDMGPKSRYLGPDAPQEDLIWQDPVPALNHQLPDQQDIAELKKILLTLGLSISDMIYTAWSSASTFRGSDKRGGANGARIRLEPQMNWDINQPDKLKRILSIYEKIQTQYNQNQTADKKISMADLIVLAGNSAIEKAIQNAGFNIDVPFLPGRTDATQDMTDVESFAVLEPYADGFRNYLKTKYTVSAEELLIDKAQLLTLTAPEMTVLVGGLRVLNINYKESKHGVFTDKKETLSNDFFVNLLEMNTVWKPVDENNDFFDGYDSKDGKLKWTASRVDLIFGSNSQLRAIAEVYACDDSKEKFICDFISAWNKVMNADRFDLKKI